MARPVLRQPRSLRTDDRILQALESLLSEPGAGAPTMEALADRAHVSVGSLYKRFDGKRSLLPALLERVMEKQHREVVAFVGDPRWVGVGLGDRVHAFLRVFAEHQHAQQALFRGMLLEYLADTGARDSPRNRALFETIHAWLLDRIDEARHPNPRLALSLALFTTLQAIQTAVVFRRLPPAVPLDLFVDEMTRLFTAYLVTDPGSASDYDRATDR